MEVRPETVIYTHLKLKHEAEQLCEAFNVDTEKCNAVLNKAFAMVAREKKLSKIIEKIWADDTTTLLTKILQTVYVAFIAGQYVTAKEPIRAIVVAAMLEGAETLMKAEKSDEKDCARFQIYHF